MASKLFVTEKQNTHSAISFSDVCDFFTVTTGDKLPFQLLLRIHLLHHLPSLAPEKSINYSSAWTLANAKNEFMDSLETHKETTISLPPTPAPYGLITRKSQPLCRALNQVLLLASRSVPEERSLLPFGLTLWGWLLCATTATEWNAGATSTPAVGVGGGFLVYLFRRATE